MESYKSKQLPYIETEKYIISKESPKKILLNSEKIKEITTTPSRVPSGISTSQEYQIESNKLSKSKSSQKQNSQNKNNYIIFKNCLDNKKEIFIQKKSKDNKNNIKQANSFDKIKKNNININNMKINNNAKTDKKTFIEKNLNKKENVKNEMNEIIQNFIDNNLQNNKNCNFFRLFKMKRRNQNHNNNNEEKFPPLFGKPQQLETEQNVVNKEGKYLNLLTTQNEDNTIHYRDNLLNSVNKKKTKENRIFIKIDEHFNKLKNDKSPKLIKKCYQGVIKSTNINNNNNMNNNPNLNINVNANNGMNISNNQNGKNNDSLPKQNNRALTYEKYVGKNNKSKEKIITINDIKNNKSPIFGEKKKKLSSKNNKIKLKLNTPKTKNIYANKEEFDIRKNKEKLNLNRKNTPNCNIITNNISNTIQTKHHNNYNHKNKINFDFDVNKTRNKKVDLIDDNAIGDSFRDELNIIISDVNNCKKENLANNFNDENKINDFKKDDSLESEEEIKLNLNYNDDSIEKNIPKEQEEIINKLKQFNRPETSYGRQKK